MRRLLMLLFIPFLGAGWFFVAAPLLAAQGLQADLEARDGAAVAGRVDFTALRADLDADIEDALDDVKADPMSARMIRAMMSDLSAEFLTQQSLAQAVEAGGLAQALGVPEGVQVSQPRLELRPGRLSIIVDAPQGASGIVLAPRGMAWKVVGVDLPLRAVFGG